MTINDRPHPTDPQDVPLDDPLDEPPISESEVRSIVRLLAEVAVTANTIPEKKRTLATGLAELVGADHWIWVVSKVGDDQLPTYLSIQHSDLPPGTIAAFLHRSQNAALHPPETAVLFADLVRGQPFTRTGPDRHSDSPRPTDPKNDQDPRANGLEEFLYSIVPLGPGLFSGVGFHRGPGRPRFCSRERRLTHLVMGETHPLHGAGVPQVDTGDTLNDLSPRQRTVFGLLLDGWHRRQIATELGISPHTVADHMKAIYRHFEVGSQRELLHRFRVGHTQPTETKDNIHAPSA